MVQRGFVVKPGAYLLQPGKEALLVEWRWDGKARITIDGKVSRLGVGRELGGLLRLGQGCVEAT